MKLPSERTILRKIEFILDNAVDRELFAVEWSRACARALHGKSHDKLVQLLEEWYATAETDAIPGARKAIFKAHAQRISGRLKGTVRRQPVSSPGE